MKKIYIPFLLALAVTACQEGNITPQAPAINDQMSFNVLVPGIQTKVTNDAFEATDVIGLYVTDYADETTPMPLQISGNRANNLPVTFDGAVWTPEQTIYWGEGKSDVYAYYPYMDDITDVESLYFEVAADQTGGGYESSDLLWAKAGGVKQTDGAVNLQMSHVMSKLTVKIVAGEDYVGSLPSDASVLLHSTVTGAQVDLTNGSVSKNPYSGAKSIKMKKLGIRTVDGADAVVYEAIVVPQMIERSVPLFEINSKSVSYLIEDYFNFRPGVAYTYTVTLNTSTTAIKVEIGCELEDWNSTGGGSGEGEEGGEDSGEDEEGKAYADLSAAGTANCYLVQCAGDYKFKSVIGNTDATVGKVNTVEVLWESLGTDEVTNVGDIIASVSYEDGYVCFSTPDEFCEGNALIAARGEKGTILWSWHIWCVEEGWQEHVYFNDAGIMMDRNLGATSAIPGDLGSIGLMYQQGRKDPFLGKPSYLYSTGAWELEYGFTQSNPEENPMIFYTYNCQENCNWGAAKTVHDPCPVGWQVPYGGESGVWTQVLDLVDGASLTYDAERDGIDFADVLGAYDVIWYPTAGRIYENDGRRDDARGFYWCASLDSTEPNYYSYAMCIWTNATFEIERLNRANGCSVRCQKEE